MGGQKREAVDASLDGKSYLERARRVGVQLGASPITTSVTSEEGEGEFLVELYERGAEPAGEAGLQRCRGHLRRDAKLEPDYKDANSLQRPWPTWSRSTGRARPIWRAVTTAKAYDELDQGGGHDAVTRTPGSCAIRPTSVAIPSVCCPSPVRCARRMDTHRVQVRHHGAHGTGRSFHQGRGPRENIDRILRNSARGRSGGSDEATGRAGG